MSCIMRNPDFCTSQLVSTFVFATRIVQYLLYLYAKFQDSSFLLWVYMPVCVGPWRKCRRPVFLHRSTYNSSFEQRHEKTGFCLCKNKGKGQLRSNCESDQRLCFHYMYSTISLLLKSEISSF